MGSSSSSPVALEELTQPYIVTPKLSTEFFKQHTSGQPSDQDKDLLYQVPPDLLGRVSLHKCLDLSFNSIEVIPPDLPLNLPHLTVLNLSHNRIQSIPDSLFGFIHLRLLDLSYNDIENIPSIICLFPELRKLDLSHNRVSKIPASISNLKRLEKLNVSHNNIEHLPLSLGNLPNLQVLLASNNPLQTEIQEANSKELLDHLRKCFAGSVSTLPSNHISLGNSWTRVRGSVFDSSVLNAGSAQSLFEQMQAQAVNTGNRLLTPLIPPLMSTSLNVDKFRDTILGMFYGATIGDSLGLLTHNLTPDEAEFHYSRKTMDQTHLYKDEHRCEATVGQVTPNIHLSMIMLESVMKWAGVVDELDYAEKLVDWFQENEKNISSKVLHGLMKDSKAFQESPRAAASHILENEECSDNGQFDNTCLPSMIGIAVIQFHNLQEVEENARRICSSTHSDKENIGSAIKFAITLAKILKGDTINILDDEETISGSSIHVALEHLNSLEEKGFRESLMNIIMMGGDAPLNGLVAGAVYGAISGYHTLPSVWIQHIDKSFTTVLDKKLNLLFDLMGVP